MGRLVSQSLLQNSSPAQWQSLHSHLPIVREVIGYSKTRSSWLLDKKESLDLPPAPRIPVTTGCFASLVGDPYKQPVFLSATGLGGGVDPINFSSHTVGTIWLLDSPDVCTTWMLENSAAAWQITMGKHPHTHGTKNTPSKHYNYSLRVYNTIKSKKTLQTKILYLQMIIYDNLGINAVLHSFSKLFRWHPSNFYVFFRQEPFLLAKRSQPWGEASSSRELQHQFPEFHPPSVAPELNMQENTNCCHGQFLIFAYLHQTWIQYVATSTLFGCFSLTNQSKNTSGCCCCYC